MKYKVVPAAMVIQGSSTEVSAYFQKLIDEQARQGWRFYSMETATSEQAPGCVLISSAPVRTQMNLLVFCKPEPGDLDMLQGYAPQAAAPQAPVSQGSAPQAAAPKASVSQSSAPQPYIPSAMDNPAPAKASDEGWVCGNCGTRNSKNYGQCKKCGQYRN